MFMANNLGGPLKSSSSMSSSSASGSFSDTGEGFSSDEFVAEFESSDGSVADLAPAEAVSALPPFTVLSPLDSGLVLAGFHHSASAGGGLTYRDRLWRTSS